MTLVDFEPEHDGEIEVLVDSTGREYGYFDSLVLFEDEVGHLIFMRYAIELGPCFLVDPHFIEGRAVRLIQTVRFVELCLQLGQVRRLGCCLYPKPTHLCDSCHAHKSK